MMKSAANLSLLLSALACGLAQAAPVSGVVRDGEGRPVGGAVVYGLGSADHFSIRNNVVMAGEGVPRALTHRDGTFTLPADEAHITKLLAQDMEDAWGIARVAGGALPAEIIVGAPARGAVHVRRGAAVAAGENIELVRHDGEGRLVFSYAGKSNDGGVFRTPALAPGTYEVRTWEEVPQVGCCFRRVTTRAAQLEVAPGSSPEITLGGTDLPSVRGRIAGTDGEGLHGVWVRLLPESGGDAEAIVYSAVTEEDGSYAVYDVAPGDYTVRCFRRLAMNDGGRTLEDLTRLRVAAGTSEPVRHDVAIDLTPFLPLEPGQVAPAIDGSTLAGEAFSLAELRGQYVVVHFYAAWCKPCVDTIAQFDALAGALDGVGRVGVVGISVDETEQEARDFAREKEIGHPLIYQGSWASNPLRAAYRVSNIPSTFIIGPDGRIAHIDLHGEVLVAYLRSAMQ